MRNQVRRQWQRNRNFCYKNVVNNLNQLIKEEIQKLRNTSWNFKLSSIKPSHQNLWKAAKFLKKTQIMPPLKLDDSLALTADEKANTLADTFQKAHDNPLANKNQSFTNNINQKVETYLMSDTNEDEIDLPDINEIHRHIKGLKNNKAPGFDRIHNRLVKNLPTCGVHLLYLIIIACLKLSYFPTKWKHANVIAIRKPGKDLNLPSSYRPISLLSSLSKILERVILERIMKHVDSNKILPSSQYGFVSKKSTTHQLFRIVEFIKNQFKLQKSTGMVLIDVEKAFDRVWHQGLIFKLIKFKFPRNYVKIVSAFLKNRSFQVTVNNKSSNFRQFYFGLPQGAVLSPILYNIFTADIPSPKNCNLALFADDTAFYASSKFVNVITENLKNYSLELQFFFDKWKINLNHGKTEAIFFTKRLKKELPGTTINIFNKTINWSDTVKYLGITLDKRLIFAQHINNIVLKTNNCIKLLFPLISRNSKMNIANKLLIYKAIIRPILTYGCPVFHNIAKIHLNKLQVFQNKFLKRILQLPPLTRTKEVHGLTKMPMMELFMEKLSRNFQDRL
jgi:methyl coenzyme M reductase subunit D